MKCQNCNSELLEDAKFCTTCGTPSPLRPQAPCARNAMPRCCPTRGSARRAARAVEPRRCTGVTGAGRQAGRRRRAQATVKQKIFWNIQKGEVACRVNESEFIRYDSAQGLIVNDGTTAYIKANGKVLAEIHGGIYDFVDPDRAQARTRKPYGRGCGAGGRQRPFPDKRPAGTPREGQVRRQGRSRTAALARCRDPRA